MPEAEYRYLKVAVRVTEGFPATNKALPRLRFVIALTGPDQPLAIMRARMGLSTKIAKPTTTKFMIAVATNTMCQLPVASLIRLAIGTRNADVPLAV